MLSLVHLIIREKACCELIKTYQIRFVRQSILSAERFVRNTILNRWADSECICPTVRIKKFNPLKFKLSASYCINLTALNASN